MRDTEEFWKGDFGSEYTARNDNIALVEANVAFFRRIFCEGYVNGFEINSVIEFGANRGLNILAFQQILGLPSQVLDITAVEINGIALAKLLEIEDVEVIAGSVLNFEPIATYDLSLSKGLLIHIHPDDLPKAYKTLYDSSRRYILLAEYFSPKPEEIEYRGHKGRLWKRDFGGDMWDLYPDMKLVDYGFSWKRDPVAPQDDLTWWLFEKP